MGKRRLDRIVYHLITCAFFLMGRISPRKAARMAGGIGRVWFALDRHHRKTALDNLAMVYGGQMSPAEIRGFARRVFCNIARIPFEIGWGLYLDEVRLRRYFRFYGMHHLAAARKKNKGVLVLTAHIGNWELLISAAGLLGMPVSAVYRPLAFAPMDMFISDFRSRCGGRLYPKKSAMRNIVRGLKNNETVGILLDQSAKRSGAVFVGFFGRPAATASGLAVIAKRMQAPVIPAFLVREADGAFSVIFGAEVPFFRTGDPESDIRENTKLYNREIESVIRKYPEQWFWVHKRWKERGKKRAPR